MQYTSANLLFHGDFVIERHFVTNVERLFNAWSDIELKALWFRGADSWSLRSRTLNFFVGGEERLHGEFSNGVETLFIAKYHVIQPNQAIVYTYDMYYDNKHSSVSLASVAFSATNTGSMLVYREQGVYLTGENGTEHRKVGTATHLDRLGHLFAKG